MIRTAMAGALGAVATTGVVTTALLLASGTSTSSNVVAPPQVTTLTPPVTVTAARPAVADVPPTATNSVLQQASAATLTAPEIASTTAITATALQHSAVLNSGIVGVVFKPQPPAAPSLQITNPAHGDFDRYGFVGVMGTVKAPAGLSVLTVNGDAVTVNSDGSFWTLLLLNPGLNIIDVEATDDQGRTCKDTRSVLSGNFQAAGTPIDNGLVVRLNQGSLNAAGKEISSKLSGQMLSNEVMSQNPLSSASGWWGSSTVSATSVSMGNPTITFSPTPGALNVQVVIPNVNVQIQEIGSWDIPNASGYVSCSNAVLDAQVAMSVQNGVLTTQIVNDSVNLQNFNWGINGIPGFLTGLFSGDVQGAIQNAVSSMVKKALPPEVNKLIKGAAGDPIHQTILGSTATVNLAPNGISIDANGLTASVNADCSMATLPDYTPISAPLGSLALGGPAPTNGGPGPDFFASINDDLLNRIGFAVWQSGATDVLFDDATGSGFKLPAGLALDMAAFQTFIPELKGVGSPSDPVTIKVHALLPPVFKSSPGATTLEADIGDLELNFVDTVTNQTVMTMYAHVRLSAMLTLNGANLFDASLGSPPYLTVSVTSKYAPSIDPFEIDLLALVYLPSMIETEVNQWSGFPLPTYPGLTPVATSIYADGAQATFMTAAGNFTAGGATLPNQ